MKDHEHKIRVGITIGDVNGIGIEVMIKCLLDSRVLDMCIPVVYGSPKALSYHRKTLHLESANHHTVKQPGEFKKKTINVVPPENEEVIINLGQPSEMAGKYALNSIDAALADLKNGLTDVLVTAPINKNTIKPAEGTFTGHTEYITDYFGAEQSLMFLVGENLRVGLVTNHLPVKDVAENLTGKKILDKLRIMNQSLIRDFGIDKPRIALLGLNPHAGDNGLLGDEEQNIIMPAMQKARNENMLVFGPFPADGFFAAASYKNYDAVLAMYHDQGLIPFKTITFGQGVNFTAGLPIVRTSPDHGTAYDIAGKNEASEASFRHSLFTALDIFRTRQLYDENHKNPIKKQVLARE